MNLNFYIPTKIIMTDDCVNKNRNLLKELGNKALIVTGTNSAKKNGSLSDVTQALTSVSIDYVIFDQVMTNPTIECVYNGANFANEKQVDFIIAIGGGSPMDAAKAINLIASQNIKEENLFDGNYSDKIMPMIFIPTTAGTGSEVTPYSILTDDKIETKKSISSPILFPTIAFLDARYMKDLPITVTINTAIDALSHAVEGMLSLKATTLTNALAIESIKKIKECFYALTNKEVKQRHREKLLYASMVAGMVISHTGTTAVHAMGYGLTYFKNIDHGRANGLLLVSFLRRVQEDNKNIIREILEALSLRSLDELDNIIDTMLGEKESISQEEFEKYASIAVNAANIKNCSVVLTEEDIVNLYLESFHKLSIENLLYSVRDIIEEN